MALELQHTKLSKSMSREDSTRQRRPNHLELPKGLSIQSLQKRPSIAPVPAVLEANDIRIQLNSDVESDDDESDIPFADADDDGYPE